MKTVFIADDGVKEDAFSKVIGKYTDGVYVTGPKDVSQNPMALAAIDTYRQVFGTEPGLFYLNAYAAVLALLNAVEKTGSTDYAMLKKALHTETVDTPLGKIRFDTNGDVIGVGFSVYQVQNGTFVEIK
jgi:branched-chain amino acid transport system substrate-binding protein